MREVGIYIHIPFCVQKCHYCDFASFSNRGDWIEEYVMSLVSEMYLWKEELKDIKVKSVFIGGGTPTILSPKQIDPILSEIHKNFSVEKGIEFSIESNPGTITQEKLKYYLQSNINRLSMGLQAWQDELLVRLGRIHTQEVFVDNYQMAREVGFENINVDLMFGLPNQTVEQWRETLNHIVALKPEHLSTYSLKIEEGTPFYDQYEKNQLVLPKEEEDRAMYHAGISILSSHGYDHYEISNFARESKECVHNKIYWENKEYIGLGLGAHSFKDKERFSNAMTLPEYIGLLKEGKKPIVQKDLISCEEEMAESIFLGLRMMKGVHIRSFKERYGVDPMKKYASKIPILCKKGLLKVENEWIRLTDLGVDLSNQVFVEFLPD